METIILPTILTATETFNTKRKDVEILQYFMDHTLRKMTETKDNCPETWLHYELNILPIYDQILQKRLRLLHRIVNSDEDNLCQILVKKDSLNFLTSSLINIGREWEDDTILPKILNTTKKHTVKSTLKSAKGNLLRKRLTPPNADIKPWTTRLEAPYKKIARLNMSPQEELVILHARIDLTYGSNTKRHEICYRCPMRRENTLMHEIMECTFPRKEENRRLLVEHLNGNTPKQQHQWLQMTTSDKLQTLLGIKWRNNKNTQWEIMKYTAGISMI